MKYLSILLILCFIAPIVSATSEISAYSTGDDSHIKFTHCSESSTNLYRFGQTNGSYYYQAADQSSTTLGMTGYSLSARAGETLVKSTEVQSLGLMISKDVAAIHNDQTNMPSTLCDTQGLAISPENSTNTTISSKYPITQESIARVDMRGAGDGTDNAAKYTSNTEISGLNLSLEHTTEAYTGGSNIEDLRSSITAGHNDTVEIPQYADSQHYHASSYSNDTAGLSAGSIIKFTGHSYTGGNTLTGWKPAYDEAVNNTTPEEG